MRKPNRCLPLIILALLAACASGQPGSSTVITIDVRNDLIPPANVEIFLVPRGGIERMVGRVTSGDHSLRYTGLAPVGDHYLLARAPSGRAMTSSILTMDGVTGLSWVLSSNLLRVTATREQQ